MSILSAGTTNSTALNLTADTSGSLILASNNNVTAVTIHANQNATFANTAKFPTTIGVGAATASASGAGITFPATQSASSDANTLDDYEEGSWTPTLGGTSTYSTQEGKYTRIGNFVYAVGIVVVTLIGTGSTTTISGLPFTSAVQANRFPGSIAFYASIVPSIVSMICFTNNNSVTVQFGTHTTSGVNSDDTKAIFGNSAHVQFSVCYRV